MAVVAVAVCMGLCAHAAHLWVLRSFGLLAPAVGAMGGVAADGAACAMATAVEGEAVPMGAELALAHV